MHMIRRRLVLPLAGAALATPRLAAAQSGSGVPGWPNRPVRIVVGFPPGGLPDVYARMLADRMSPVLGQPVVVENRVGSGGVLANEQVARTDDGHTFLSTSISLPVGAALRAGQVGYDVMRDFAPVSMLSAVANGIFVHEKVPATDIAGFVALAKSRPGAFSAGSPGNGTSGHVTQEYFKLRTGIDMVHVPYRGASQLAPAFLAGQVDVVIDNLPLYLPHVREGKLRLLAVTTPQRWPMAPDAPTLSETILPGFDVRAWFGLVAPARTPEPVLAAMNRLTVAALNDPTVAARIRQAGAEPWPTTREEFRRYLEADHARWVEVVRVSGARVD